MKKTLDNEINYRLSVNKYDQVKQVIEKNLLQKKETGEAQQATRIRDERLDELAVFVSEMRGIAKLAMDDTPDWRPKGDPSPFKRETTILRGQLKTHNAKLIPSQ